VPDVLVHSGGAITSYVEWLKSLENVKPGRLTKKWEEISKLNMLNVVGQVLKVDQGQLQDYQLD
jgi:glutamate dehydrogenase (NAD(P)+)